MRDLRTQWFVVMTCIALLALASCSQRGKTTKHIKKAEIFLRENQLTKAADELDAALRIEPDNVEALYDYGCLLQRKNEYDGAIEKFNKALSFDPDRGGIYVELGKTYALKGDFSALASLSAQMIDNNIKLGHAHYFAGVAAAHTGDTDTAVASYKDSLEADPKFTPSYLELATVYATRKQLDKAEQTLRDGLARIGDESSQLRIALARTLMYENKDAEAIKELLLDIQEHPKSVETRALLGDLYVRSGQFDKLKQLSNEILVIDERSVWGHYLSGIAKVHSEDYERAIDDLKRVATNAPDLDPAHMYLALAYDATGANQQAISEARKFLAAEPEAVSARLILSRLYLKERWLDDARQLLEETANIAPDNPDVLKMLGNLNLGGHEFDAAIGDFERVLKADPEDISAKLSLAAAALGKKQINRAETLCDELISAYPDDPRPLNLLGLIELERGNVFGALRKFDDSTTMSPTFQRGYVNAARLYAALQRPDLAAAQYRRALANTAESTWLRLLLAAALTRTDAYAEATGELSKVLDAEPESVAARLMLAEAYAKSGRAEDAKSTILEALQSDPENMECRFALGKLYANSGDYGRAAPEFHTALSQRPDYFGARVELAGCLLADGEYAETYAVIEPVLADTAAPAVLLHLAAAAPCCRGEFERALAVLGRFEQKTRHITATSILAAIANVGMGDYEAALDEIRASTGSDETKRQYASLVTLCREKGITDLCHLAAALVLSRTGKLAAAAEACDRAIEVGGGAAAPHVLRGRIAKVQGQTERAMAAFSTALKIDNESVSVARDLANLQTQAGKIEEALATVEQVRKSAPEDVSLGIVRAGLLERLGNSEAATAEWERAVSRGVRNPVPYNNLAWLYSQNPDRLDEALKLALKAAEMAPFDGRVLDTLGWILCLKEDYARAVEPLRRANTFLPGDPTLMYHLGVAVAKTGDQNEARKHLEAALATSSDFPDADKARRMIESL